MLKRLELVGFKSFADKTTFEFAGGITGIVGPNGSGKSNIVDAVRWIMGEQSAKSLRGGEMADVIFNGSSSRKGLGMAEVTMTFDNRKRQLAIDADDVQITRRVYRDGEGEYLINGQLGRLRDIKDMFLGSGAGNDALCIIAQGKVDVLLQASTKDRRTIFEEAAGISRFRAKKIETLRKLERVEQNLSRVKDIIDEVDKQLRSVKLQASKAMRYREYSDRLKELRLAVGKEEYQLIEQRLQSENAVLESLRGELDQRAARAGACEAEVERLEMALADLDDLLREREAALAKTVQDIKSEESTLAHEGTLSADLETELSATRRRLADLIDRVRQLEDSSRRAEAEWSAADAQTQTQRREVQGLEEHLHAVECRLKSLHDQSAADKAEHFEMMRRVAHLRNEAFAKKAHVDNLRRERERLHNRSTQAEENLASIDLELQELIGAEEQLQARLVQAKQRLAETKQERDRARIEQDRLAAELSSLRQGRSGIASRVEVLEGLIRSHEGLGTGVREVFSLLDQPEPGPWTTVLGMIADFLTVKREYAPLIDLALGDWAQRFVVRDVGMLVVGLRERGQAFSGRVSFMPFLPGINETGEDAVAALRNNRLVEVSLLSRVRSTTDAPAPDHPGLVAPAEQLVSCEHPDLADLPAQLLGRTLIVRDLAAAHTLAERAPGFRFVTLQGELLEPDGTLTVGSHHADSGILSRKSELRDLLTQRDELDHRISAAEHETIALRHRHEDLVRQGEEQEEEVAVLAEQTAEMRSRVQSHRDRRQGLHAEVESHRGEIEKIDQEIAGFESAWCDAEKQAEAAETQVQILHERLRRADDAMRETEIERGERQQACTQAQVRLATMEERLSGLRSQHQTLTRDYEQRRREYTQGEQSLATCKARLQESQRAMLHASQVLAHAFAVKESLQRETHELIAQRDFQRQERARLAQQGQIARGEWRAQQEQYHQREIAVTNLRHQRDTLVSRLREDYQVELADLLQTAPEPASEPTPEGETSAPTHQDMAAAQQEIDELRKKLAKLGSVNLDALDELHELETRSTDLHAQFTDLVDSQKSLQDIISKINTDSRKMFLDTFTTVRGHFQELFRKLFGGGMADVVLEDENDVLESGIEVVARPPGKELRSISLLSGGEKTLAAVALLLAVFRSKPSPFCILDEVDAALDEANIGRFTAVIREFLDLSQFIIVTHSKKTMAAADVLYGITMQESGISKQVAIRFEDWIDADGKSESAA
jgi:chromosome segregation protein